MAEPTVRLSDRIYEFPGQVPRNLIERAAAAVRAGKLIVLPTDTVYGVGANAFDAQAIQALLNAKHRGRDMPPPVLIAMASILPALGRDIPPAATALAEAFWPGALTIIVKALQSTTMELGETHGTIALRVPDHPDTVELLKATGPMAVTSANISGMPAATTAREAVRMLQESVEIYLDAGPSPKGVASTIVDFASTPAGRIVRMGALSCEQLRRYAPDIQVDEHCAHADPAPDSQAHG